MKRTSIFLIIWSIMFSSGIKAQDSTNVYGFDLKKFKPIVQVFGTGKYNFEEHHYGYEFGRAHVGMEYKFNDHWNAKIIIDRGPATSVGELTVTDTAGNILNITNTSKEGSVYTMFLKFASLKWQVNNKFSLEGGALLQNHYITQERFWGLRYVAQTFQDLYWKIPSTDLGFMVRYKINNVFSFDAALTNGEGPRKNQDVFGKIKFAAGLDFNPVKKIETRIYYHNRVSGIDSTGTEQMFSVFAGYKPSEKWRIGGEYNFMNNLNYVEKLKSTGFSIYTSYYIAKNLQIFARYDRLYYENPETLYVAQYEKGNTLISGISYAPVKKVHLSLNVQKLLPESTSKSNENSLMFSMEFVL